MFGISERDLFVHSLSGDWRSRVEFYRKFIHVNARVRRLGASYPDINDFLHDCFTNILRKGHSLHLDDSIGDWVESVAVCTALEQARRDIDGSGTIGLIRMCAAIEGEDPGGRKALAPYVPPRTGSEHSLFSLIATLVGEPQNTLLRTRAKENNTWDDTAAAAGRAVNTIGPILVRAVDRLSLFFGAPPTLNDDLEPVFPDVSPENAVAGKASHAKPAGRVISMQLDPLFYAVTPEMRKIGLTVPAEVRTIALWDAARISATPPKTLRDHLEQCHYCSDLLRALRLMQRALISEPNVDFCFCPNASTLLQDLDEDEEPLSQHLLECALCRDERTRAFGRDVQPGVKAGMRFGNKIFWVAAAAIILGGVFFYLVPRINKAFVVVETVAEQPLMNVNVQYASLAERVVIDDNRVMDSVLYTNQFIFMEARDLLRQGKRAEAMLMAQQLVNAYRDPGGQLLYAECVYSRSVGEGYLEMQKAEAMPPRNSYRCWVALQLALRVGDKATVEREVGHLSSDPDLGDRAENILAQMRAIK